MHCNLLYGKGPIINDDTHLGGGGVGQKVSLNVIELGGGVYGTQDSLLHCKMYKKYSLA